MEERGRPECPTYRHFPDDLGVHVVLWCNPGDFQRRKSCVFLIRFLAATCLCCISRCPSTVSAKASLAVNQPFGTRLPSRSDDQNPQSLRDFLEPTQRHFQRGGEERKCGFWGRGWHLSSPQLGEGAPAWELQVMVSGCALCSDTVSFVHPDLPSHSCPSLGSTLMQVWWSLLTCFNIGLALRRRSAAYSPRHRKRALG